MSDFQLKNGELYAEEVSLARIAAEVGTPVHVYSQASIERQAQIFRASLQNLGPVNLAFAVKANPNLAVLRIIAREGFGADIVSAGEMARALASGIPAHKIVFSGVGKTRSDLIKALDAGVGQFNLEHEAEGHLLSALAAERGVRAAAALRVNPDVEAATHEKISTGKADNKFGVPLAQAPAIYSRLAILPGLRMRGVACHIGSQLKRLAPLEAAYSRMGDLIKELRTNGHVVESVDLGGGLGVPYHPSETVPSPAELGEMVARITKDWATELTFEPGRVIVAEAGVLLTEVIWVKPGATVPYIIVDAAMNDLARPALYDAYHHFVAIKPSGEKMVAHIAGPICETGDTFAMDRQIDCLDCGDLAAFLTTGAYGATMASTYNSRPLVPEVLVHGDRYAVVAERVSIEAMMRGQHVPTWLNELQDSKSTSLQQSVVVSPSWRRG